MKLTNFRHLLVLSLVLAIAASACRKRPDYVTKIPPGKTGVGDMPPGNRIDNEKDANSGKDKDSGLPSVDPTKFDKYDPHPEILQKDTVYFDFDSSFVKATEKAKVPDVADYLKANPTSAVRVEGHCDERGTEEYNRSLGERRALALREELAALGADPNRIVTVTFGKDRPAVSGHDESAWKRNRRGEFVVLTPPK